MFTLYLRCSRTRYDIVDPAVLAKHDTTSTALAAAAALGRRGDATLVRPGIEVFWCVALRVCCHACARLAVFITLLTPPHPRRAGTTLGRYFSCRETSAALFYGLTALAPTTRFYTLASGMDAVIRRLLTHPNILVRCDSPVVNLSSGLQVTYGRGDAVGVDKFQVRGHGLVAGQRQRTCGAWSPSQLLTSVA